jgi:glutamine synthetase
MLYDAIEALKVSLAGVPKDAERAAAYYHDVVIPGMNDLRREADILEEMTDKAFWPYPTYSDLLFY